MCILVNGKCILCIVLNILSHCLSPVRVCGLECSQEASEWLTTVLGTHCKLIQQDPLSQRISKVPSASKGNGSDIICSVHKISVYVQYIHIIHTYMYGVATVEHNTFIL